MRNEVQNRGGEMIVGIMAPPWKEIPPAGYGGIEEVVYGLVSALKKLGIMVVMYSLKKTAKHPAIRQLGISVGWHFNDAQYDNIHNPLLKVDIERIQAKEGWQWLIKQRVDVILDHTGSPVFLETVASSTIASSLSKIGPPILHTLHGLSDEYERQVFTLPGAHFIPISEAQKAFVPVECFTVIHNGVRVAEFPFNSMKSNYLLNVGRITPVKGQLEAIQVAQTLGKTLVIAGFTEPTPEGLACWQKEFLPRITVDLQREQNRARRWERFRAAIADSPQIVFWGEADFEDKVKLYQDAFCFLMPILWPEPFGMVMIEAMACGTPVVAFRQGAAPEVVKHGETGFVVDNLEQMIDAVKVVNSISPEACRQRVQTHFSDIRMARDYLGAMRSILRNFRKQRGVCFRC